MAADSLIRNWQRRSKKWRRSLGEQEKSEDIDVASNEKESEGNKDPSDQSTKSTFDEMLKDENDNVSRTPPGSPTRTKCRKNAQEFAVRSRPASLVLSSEFQLLEHENRLKDRVLSDTNLSTEKAPDRSPDIWIPRQRNGVLLRTTSDGVRNFLRSRNSSLDASSIFGSKKSLSHASKESLADSGVSETPENSPSNTLVCRTRKMSAIRNEALSLSLTNVAGTTETKRKLSHLNRRSWGECVSVEVENEPNGLITENYENDEANSQKNKRGFKDVMKKLFVNKKK